MMVSMEDIFAWRLRFCLPQNYMSQTPANYKELWDLYKIGAAGLDVLAMIVKDTDEVLAGDLAGNTDLPKSPSNLAMAIQNAIVKSSSGGIKAKETAPVASEGHIPGLDTPTEPLKKGSTTMSVREIYMVYFQP